MINISVILLILFIGSFSDGFILYKNTIFLSKIIYVIDDI